MHRYKLCSKEQEYFCCMCQMMELKQRRKHFRRSLTKAKKSIWWVFDFFFFKKKGFVLFCAVTAWIFFPDLSNSVIKSHCILAKRPRSDSTINHKRSLSQHHGSVISVCQRIRQSGRGYECRHRGWCFDTVGTQEALRRAVCYRIEKVIC